MRLGPVSLVSLLLVSAFGLASAAPRHRRPAAPKPPVAAKPPKPQKPAQPEVLFTFDDGPAPYTPRVLELLDQHHIKAVFFVNGVHFMGESAAANRMRDVLRDEQARGHYVGNHTVHHYFLCGKVYSQRATAEVEDNAKLIEDAVGVHPELFRTPYGAHCPPLDALFKSMGIKPIAWDIDPQDWKVKNAAIIEERVTAALKNIRGRNILLLHDIQPETVKALPNILDWLDRENEARAKDGRPQIKVIDYSYLLPERPLVPPIFDGLGRVLLATLSGPLSMRGQALPLWPPVAPLAGGV